MVIVALNNLSCRALPVKAHEHFLNEHNTADGSPKSPKKMRDLVEPQTIFRRPFLGL
jgi:hypothetical protein